MKNTDKIQQISTGSMRKKRLPFALILLVIAAVCILLGCLRGEAALVFRQAVNICFECIGLG